MGEEEGRIKGRRKEGNEGRVTERMNKREI